MARGRGNHRIRSSAARQSLGEDRPGCIYGMKPSGEFLSIPVHKEGRSVYLSGPYRRHLVPMRHERTEEGWKHEAHKVWGLSELLYVPTRLLNDPSEKAKVDALRAKADERRQQSPQSSSIRFES
jgi:hypothetical protein